MKCSIEDCDEDAIFKVGDIYLCEQHWDMIYEVIAEILLSPKPFEKPIRGDPTETAATITEGDY